MGLWSTHQSWSRTATGTKVRENFIYSQRPPHPYPSYPVIPAGPWIEDMSEWPLCWRQSHRQACLTQWHICEAGSSSPFPPVSTAGGGACLPGLSSHPPCTPSQHFLLSPVSEPHPSPGNIPGWLFLNSIKYTHHWLSYMVVPTYEMAINTQLADTEPLLPE